MRRLGPGMAVVLLVSLLPVQVAPLQGWEQVQFSLPDTFLVYKIAPPDVSEKRASALAEQVFGFRGEVTESSLAFIVREAAPVGAPARQLVLYKNSGAVEFVDEHRYRAGYVPGLPPPEEAVYIATRFLEQHGLMPPEPTTDVAIEHVNLGGMQVPNAVAVSFTPHLTVALRPLLTAPVRFGEVIVWLGPKAPGGDPGAQVVRYQGDFPALLPVPIPVPRVAEQYAWSNIDASLASHEGLELHPAYTTFGPLIGQPYFDPFFEVRAGDTPVLRVRATNFTPSLAMLSPPQGQEIRAGEEVVFQAEAFLGNPPYSFLWVSDRDGFLGKGEKLTTTLSPGRHRIDLTVRDRLGAGLTGSAVLQVQPSAAAIARAESEEELPPLSDGFSVNGISSGTQLTGGNGVTFTVLREPERALVLDSVKRNNLVHAAKIYFDQFWYTITVRIQGLDYTMESGKCRPRSDAGYACEAPKKPFAVSLGASPLVWWAGGSILSTELRIGNLPGTLFFRWEYSTGDLYCGPDPHGLGSALLWITTFGGAKQPIGGNCPGLNPKVLWGYKPPRAGNTNAALSGKTIAEFCGQAICNIPPALLEQVQCCNAVFPVVDFKLNLLTAVWSNGLGNGEESAVVTEGVKGKIPGFVYPVIPSSEGPVDCRFQPVPVIGALFCNIRAVPVERQWSFASGGAPGDYYNLHVKEEHTLGITFVGCNNPLVLKSVDPNPCLHYHEHWVAPYIDTNGLPQPPSKGVVEEPKPGKTYSEAQDVVVHELLYSAAEDSPNHPASVYNAQSLGKLLGPDPLLDWKGEDLVMWHESIARATQCAPKGGSVDNSARPCVVFPQGVFFTPR